MTLRRTSSALHSLHRFFHVDIVVFCEGGQPLDLLSATSREGGEQNTHDVMYWNSLLQNLNGNKSYHFKSIGSKKTLNSICDDVEKEKINTITVCLDRDYDEILNRTSQCPRVCYSHGYSWENDVTDITVVKSVLSDFIGVGEKQFSDLRAVKNRLLDFYGSLTRWIEIDISLIRMGKEGVFPRNNPNNALNFQNHPSLRLECLHDKLSSLGYKRRPKRVVEIKPGDAAKSCYGKILSHAIYHFFSTIMVKYNIKKLTYDQFMRLLISRTINMVNVPALSHIQRNLNSQIHAFA